MKVYRGASSKPFSDDSHELVADVDMSSVTRIWHDAVLIRVNITKEPSERQAVAHIRLDASDVLALHAKLVTGLVARSANLDKANRRIGTALEYAGRLFDGLSLGDDYEGEPSVLSRNDTEDLLDVVGMLVEALDSKA